MRMELGPTGSATGRRPSEWRRAENDFCCSTSCNRSRFSPWDSRDRCDARWDCAAGRYGALARMRSGEEEAEDADSSRFGAD